MSVTSFKRQYASGSEKNYDAEYEARFLVVTDSKNDGPWTVRAFTQSQVPMWSRWTWANGEVDSNARAQEYTESLKSADDSKKVWIAQVKFKPVPPGQNPDQQNPDPLQRPWTATGSFIRFQRRAHKDRKGKPIVNSVEQPLPIMRNDSHYQLILDGYTATVSPSLAKAVVNAVNAKPIWGLPKRHARCDQWRHGTHYENGVMCVKHTLEFTIADEPFNERPADEGTRVCSNRADAEAGLVAPAYVYATKQSGDNRLGRIWLDGGYVDPADGVRKGGEEISAATPPFIHDIELADEVDFRALIGLPDPLPYPFV